MKPDAHEQPAPGEVVSTLFQVSVRGPGNASWKVLVRAVDAESAAGAVRARGHEVVGVQTAEMPRPPKAKPRVSCLKCGYSLGNLPAGEAGEVMCPECGVINTPELPASATVLDEIKMRQGAKSRIGCLAAALLVVVFLVAAYFVRGVLRQLGILP